MIYYLLTFIIGFYIGQRLPYWTTGILDWFEKRRILSTITPTSVDEYRLCEDLHLWIDANSINEKGEYVKISVCNKCGFIPSKNLMATEQGLERIKENRRLLDLEDKIREDFIDMEEANLRDHFKQEIENGLSFEKLIEAYNAGQNLKQRFTIYKMVRADKEKQEPRSET